VQIQKGLECGSRVLDVCPGKEEEPLLSVPAAQATRECVRVADSTGNNVFKNKMHLFFPPLMKLFSTLLLYCFRINKIHWLIKMTQKMDPDRGRMCGATAAPEQPCHASTLPVSSSL